MSETTAMQNPYRPGASIAPLFLAGRDSEQRRFEAVLRSAPSIPANVRLTGLRGVGKTVLLKRFETSAERMGWMTSREQTEPRHNDDGALADLVLGMCDAARLRLSRAARVGQAISSSLSAVRVRWQDFELLMPSGLESPRERSVAKGLHDITALALGHGYRGFLLMLDEAQVIHDEKARGGQHPLSLLVAAVNKLQEKEIPIGLILCGLPTLATNLLKARTYIERMFRGEQIAMLDRPEAAKAIELPLTGTGMDIEPGLVDRVVDETEGYPYFIQLWGAELWDAAQDAGVHILDRRLLDAVEESILRRLDVDFYDTRVNSLTPAEQDMLMLAAACSYPPLRTSEIQSKSARSQGNVNVLMGRLTAQGVVYRVRNGQYAFTAPRFHAYLMRRQKRSHFEIQ